MVVVSLPSYGEDEADSLLRIGSPVTSLLLSNLSESNEKMEEEKKKQKLVSGMQIIAARGGENTMAFHHSQRGCTSKTGSIRLKIHARPFRLKSSTRACTRNT